MNKVAAFINSGIIETYCLGFTGDKENREVQLMASLYPQVQQQIDSVKLMFSDKIFANQIKPSPDVKISLMKSIYVQHSLINKKFLPLLNNIKNIDDLHECVIANNLRNSNLPVDNIMTQELPSTNEITNFAAWVKKEQTEEIHPHINEYIAVMEGSCDMYFGNVKKSYSKGEVIFIPPHILHSAVITSAQPMFALVQRQMIV